MGISLSPDENDPVPKRVYLTLSCDGTHGPTTLPLPSHFHGDGHGYVAQRKTATDLGWRFAGSGQVYGPCCPKEGTKAYKPLSTDKGVEP